MTGLPAAAAERALGTVLVVDDEAQVRTLMSAWLGSAGYEVTVAESSTEALRLLETQPIGVALCDIRMPGHDGLWLADRIRRAFPVTAVIMATGLRDVGPAVESLRHGVIDYLTKPFARERLADAMRRAMEWHAAAAGRRRAQEAFDREVESRRLRLADAIGALGIDGPKQVDALLTLLTTAQREAYAHAHRVAATAGRVARAVGLPAAALADIEYGALLHDLGRVALLEPLRRVEWGEDPLVDAQLRLHPALGAALLERVPYLAGAAVVVREAHERLDGLGFPNGRKGDEIGVGGRVVAVADAFDTLTRLPGGPALTADAAADEIGHGSGTFYDPALVRALERVCAER